MVTSRTGSHTWPRADHATLGPYREVTRHGVDPRVEPADRVDQQAQFHPGHQLGVGARARSHGQGLAAHPGRGAVAPHSRARRTQASPPTRVGVVQELLEDAVDDQRVGPAGQTLTVMAVRGQRSRIGGVVHQREARRRHLLTLTLGVGRPALEHPFTGQRPTGQGHDGSRHPGLEHDGQPLGGHRPGSEGAHGTLDRIGGRHLDIEIVGLATDVYPATDLRLVPVGGQRGHRQPTGGAAAPGPHPGAGGHRPLAGGVGVHRRTDPSNAGIAALDGALERQGQLDLVLGGEGGQLGAPQVLVDRLDPVGLGQTEPLVTSPKVALSRASASVSATTSGSRLPAWANPCRWSATTRMPMPEAVAEVNDSTSPPYALTWVVLPWLT